MNSRRDHHALRHEVATIGEDPSRTRRSHLDAVDLTAQHGAADVPKVLRQALDEAERVGAQATIGQEDAAFERRCQGGLELADLVGAEDVQLEPEFAAQLDLQGPSSSPLFAW